MPRFLVEAEIASAFALMVTCASVLHAQPDQQPSLDTDAVKLERARVLQEMDALSDLIKVRKTGTTAPVARIANPIFRYNSPSRLYQDGSIWAWGTEGRPLVVMEMFTLNAKKTSWVQGCVLTSTELVVATRLGKKIWYPREVGVEFNAVPAAPAPSENKNLRLRQMKQISRRFTAHQYWDPNNSRFDLRLLVQPIHRYEDPNKGLVDGSLFLMAHEIEPEVIILIEAVTMNGALAWQYAVTPIGSAEFHILLDEHEIYKRGRTPMNTGYAVDPYHSFHVNAERK